MHPHAALIQRFYEAFQRRDAEGMVACYHADIEFHDPAFGDLKGKAAGDMWRMLCERGKDLRLEFRDVRADERSGAAHWEAWYTFTQTGRPVHNVIDAEFEFADGLIRRHRDRFSFYRWAGQALGPAGRLLGWTPMLHNAVSKKARASLDAYRRSKGGK